YSWALILGGASDPMAKELSMSLHDPIGGRPPHRRWFVLVPVVIFALSFCWGLFWFELSERAPVFAPRGSPTGGFEEGYLAALGAFVGSAVGTVAAWSLIRAAYRPQWILWVGLLVNGTFGAVVFVMAGC